MQSENRDVDAGLPSLTRGADPWCTWCDDDFGDVIWMIRREDESHFPPAFCSKACASAWGCARQQSRIYSTTAAGIVAGYDGEREDQEVGHGE
jgi:hypothetical protein